MSHGQPANLPDGWLAGCLAWQKVSIGHYTQTILPNVFIPAMLIGTIDFYHFMPFTLTLTLPWGQAQHEAKSIGFIFSHTFHLIRMKFDVVLKQFKMNFMSLLLSNICVLGVHKGNSCYFIDYSKQNLLLACIQMFTNQTLYYDRYCCTVYFGTSQSFMTLIQGYSS